MTLSDEQIAKFRDQCRFIRSGGMTLNEARAKFGLPSIQCVEPEPFRFEMLDFLLVAMDVFNGFLFGVIMAILLIWTWMKFA
jgi:hypothetical protein